VGGFENMENRVRVLFSGKFDYIHVGHWITVLTLVKKYNYDVLIVVLSNRKRRRKFHIRKVMKAWKELIKLSDLSDRIKVIKNKTHFGEIKIKEFKSYGCDMWVGGNKEDVIPHLLDTDIPFMFFPPVLDIHASEINK